MKIVVKRYWKQRRSYVPVYLDTRGKSSLSVAVCDRCKMKRSITELVPDPNSPGIRACRDRGCIDVYDPWRLPARQPDRIALRFARPDVPLNNFDPVYYLSTEDGFHLITEDGAFILTEDSESPIGFDP